jgi:hypothetical protein
MKALAAMVTGGAFACADSKLASPIAYQKKRVKTKQPFILVKNWPKPKIKQIKPKALNKTKLGSKVAKIMLNKKMQL